MKEFTSEEKKKLAEICKSLQKAAKAMAALKATADAAKDELRKLVGVLADGTYRFPAQKGYRFKAEQRTKLSVDIDALLAIPPDLLPVLSTITTKPIKWTPGVDKKVFDALTDEQKAAAAHFVESKPEALAISLEPDDA